MRQERSLSASTIQLRGTVVGILHWCRDHFSMMNDVTKPRMTVERYAIFDQIASGGMATVHLARLRGPKGFSRTVVVKRLLPQLAQEPDLRDMLADEARMTSRVRHPNVVPVLDVMSSDDELLLVLEYVPGVALWDLLQASRLAGRRTEPSIAAALLAGVLRGLHAAHTACNERGELLELVHRDVSPDNILVGTDGLAHLLDFGIAKATGRLQRTRGDVWKGKPSYMAPEQLRDGEVTARSDVYACAVVLWETLTGYRLFHADNDYAISVKVFEKVIDAPGRVVPGLPEGLDAVVMKGLSRDPELRYLTAAQMAAAIEEAIEPAKEEAVSAWLAELGGDALELRKRQVEAVERATLEIPQESSTRLEKNDSLPAAAANTPVARGAPRDHARWWVIGAAVLGVSALAWYALQRTPDDAPPRADPSEAATLRSPNGHETPTPSPTTDRDGAAASSRRPPAVESAPPTLPPKLPPAGPSPPKAVAPKAAPVTKPDCDPPYVVDKEGYHHMKRECL
jgi:eukaryotic-like serine/threonine-protein kinase